MNLAQALKQKNRLAGTLVRQQQILQRENSRRSDSVSKVYREAVWAEILRLSEELGVLKGRITVANIDIYPKLERLAELKARVAYITGLSKREGPEVVLIGRDQEKIEYQWTATINQEKADALVAEIQKQIDDLQDQVDRYNSSTDLP